LIPSPSDGNGSNISLGENKEKRVFIFRHLRDLNKKFVIVVFIQLLGDTSYYHFIGLSMEILHRRFGQEEETSKNLITMMLLVIATTIPFIAYIINKYGKKSLAAIIASLCLLSAFVFLRLLPSSISYFWLIPALVLIALFHTFFTIVLNLLVFFSVPSRAAAMAVGVSTMVENIGLTIYPMITGRVLKSRSIDSFNNYIDIQLLLCLALVGFAVLLFWVDYRGNKVLFIVDNDGQVEKLREALEI